jgi:hypothetical protein
MRAAGRLVRGADGRRTRFHSYRGDFIGLRQVAHVPVCVWQRFRPPPDPRPWLSAGAIRVLGDAIDQTSRVVEFGGGDSTLWLATHCGYVLCFEDDTKWAAYVGQRLHAIGAPAPVDIAITADFAESARSLDQESFDVAIVDHMEQSPGDRLTTIGWAMAAVRPGGLLVLDDSDRPEFRRAEVMMATWESRRVNGFRSRPLQAAETTFWRRPAP